MFVVIVHNCNNILQWFKSSMGGKKAPLHRPGIEPGSPAWQASILPLDHRCLYLYRWKDVREISPWWPSVQKYKKEGLVKRRFRPTSRQVLFISPDEMQGMIFSFWHCIVFKAIRIKIWRGHPGSNQGPLDLQSNALPLSYIPYSSRKKSKSIYNRPFQFTLF